MAKHIQVIIIVFFFPGEEVGGGGRCCCVDMSVHVTLLNKFLIVNV